MPSSERGFAHIFLVVGLFLLILVMALFFLQVHAPSYGSEGASPVKPASAANDQADKTYTNFGLSFSYLGQNFYAKEDTETDLFKRENGDARKNFTYYVGYAPGEVSGAVDLVGKVDNSQEDAPFAIWIFNNPDNLDAAAWFKKYWYYPFNWGQFESSQKVKLAPVNATTIGGEPANFGEIDYQAGDPKYYYVSKNGKMYLIRELNNDKTIDSLKFL